jgi:hypothetical protein
MEQVVVFEEKVALTPQDLRGSVTNFKDILLTKLKGKLENRCSRHGFVKPGSLEILSKSMGYAEKGRFTSDFLYHIKAQGKVLFPPEGAQVQGTVIRKNKMGLYLVIEDAIKVMVPRDLHIGNEQFDEVEMGDTVLVEIKKSRFQVNDRFILSIGMFVNRIGGAARRAPVAVAAPTGVPGVLEGVEDDEEDEDEEGGASAAAAPAEGEGAGGAGAAEERQLETVD